MFHLKQLKRFCSLVSRLRKWKARKSNMRQFKLAIGMLGLISCSITIILYYWYHRTSTPGRSYIIRPMSREPIPSKDTADRWRIVGTPMRHVPLNEIYKDSSKQDGDDFELEEHKLVQLIDTPGCQIPVAVVDYEKYLGKLKNPATCGRRAVFLKKVSTDKVHVTIKANIIKRYLRRSTLFDCCYRSIFRSTHNRHRGSAKIKFTSCSKLHDGDTISLETDFINIKCSEYDKRNVSHVIYDDVYAFAKKINISTTHQAACKDKFNVLMLGMDSMSLPRFAKTMTRTVTFFKDNFWLAFRGYHKVGDNTFPNVMAALTGRNLSTLAEKCKGKMDQCNDLLIWNTFKEAGYVTAYGEDYLRLPDTFSRHYAFKKPPTDHYMKPLFLKGETELNNKSLVCAGKVSSGQQLLDYALDFALTYRRDSYFGLFWMNSFSHNTNSRPQDADKMFENFFNQLTYTGVLYNTFVIVFSDHGIRFGEHRLKPESYYDERIPFMFLWTPTLFKGKRILQYKYLAINQFRLMTPYDIYNTLVEIKKLSICEDFSGGVSEACSKCHSIFDVISENRTCEDVAIPDKWCSCHKLYPLDVQDTDAMKSVLAVVSYIKSKIKSVKTKRCWGCLNLNLKNIVRIHFYYDKQKTSLYHVVAFTMTPGNVSYEATVLRKAAKTTIVGTVSVISPYRGLGECTIQPQDHLFCVCQKVENCPKNS